MKQYSKLDDNTIKVIEQIVVKPAESTYVYDDVVSNLASLKQKKIDFNTDIDKRITDAQALKDAADGFGLVKVTPIEEVSEAAEAIRQ